MDEPAGQLLSCSHRAADLMQDTFMRLLLSKEALEVRQPRPFLAKVARSVLQTTTAAHVWKKPIWMRFRRKTKTRCRIWRPN